MDFSHPPVLIDGCFPAIFTVRDLASHQQLLWLPAENETADTVICGLHELFEEHGAPLVLKCDNGPGFVAQALKQFLCDRSVVTLYSPPYAPWYNGAIERANRSLKEITEHVAEQGGHAGYWTSPDLHAAAAIESSDSTAGIRRIDGGREVPRRGLAIARRAHDGRARRAL